MSIAIPKSEWDRINRWNDTSKEDPNAVRRRDYLKYLNDTSREMTKEWPNSLENVNKRNEEIRRARQEMADQVNSRFYKKYVKRKQAEEKRLMYSARDHIFKNKDAPKLLLSAVVESVVLKEREVQLDFQRERKKEKDAEKKADDDDTIRKAKEWEKMKADQARMRFEVNKKVQQEIVQQAKENAEKQRKEREDELKMQIFDNNLASAEIETLKKFDEQMKKEEKARIFASMEESRKELEHRRREQAALEKMDDDLIAVLNKSNAKIVATRKQNEKEFREEKQRVLDEISKRLQSGTSERDARENAILQKAVAEREAAIEARHKADIEKKRKFKQGRIDDRAEFLRNEEQRIKDQNTLKQWEMINKYKNNEIYKDYLAKVKAEKYRKVAQFRQDMINQWHERDERVANDRAQERKFYGEDALKKMRLEDNKLLTYAATLLYEAEINKRPTRPIRQAIERYCRMYRLFPMPPLPKSMQEHFRDYCPTDHSLPDPTYKEPPAPPPVPDWDAPDEEEPPGDAARPAPARRDGMADITNDLVQLVIKPDKEENIKDFERCGPANGLQRPPSALDPTLDKCPDPQCRCRLSFDKKK